MILSIRSRFRCRRYNTPMAETEDGWTPTTVYRLTYRKPRSAERGGRKPSPSSAVVRFDRMLAGRNVIQNGVPPEIAIPLSADAAISTYGRDYLPPSRAAALAKWSSRRRPESTGPVTAASAAGCERPTAAPRTNVTYSGPAPPEPYVAPRTEYWWTHGQLAGRAIAGGAVPKRTKRCQRINPTRIF